MTDLIPSPPDQNEKNHHHDHHNDHVENLDPIAIIEQALARAADDVGAIYEPAVIEAFAHLKANDLPSYMRLRGQAKLANKGCLVTALDKAVSNELPGGGETLTAIDELVAIARDYCELAHDADRNAIAIIPYTNRREVWRVESTGFEEWLRAAYWRAKETGVNEMTIKSALATLSAAAINDGDEVEIHIRAAQGDAGYYIDLCDAAWRVIHVSAHGWRVLEQSPVYFIRTQSMRSLAEPIGHGDMGLLWQHTNIPAASRVMVLAWLLDCFRPNTPFPVLELVGEQGSAK